MLYKLASKKKKKGNMYEAAAVGVAAPLGVGQALTKGTHLGFNYVDKNFKNPEITDDKIKEIYKHVGGDKKIVPVDLNLNVNDLKKNPLLVVRSGNDSSSGSAFTKIKLHGINENLPTIQVSNHSPESIVAHEMGHSTSKFINNKAGLMAYGLSKGFTPLVGIGAGVRYARARARGANKAELDKIKKQDDITAAATSLPMVGEETRANLIGLRTMKRMGQLNKRNLIPLALSEASYLSFPAMTPLAHKIVDKYYDWKQKK